jgi:hypothetical protein
MILRTGADLNQLGQGGKLSLRQFVGHERHEDRCMPLHGDTHEKTDLVLHHIGCGHFSPGISHTPFSSDPL